jgi:DNA-binding PadR family transcriptional regulator
MQSRPERDDLTTTSYALLGLLSIRPWTTYEMAGQMDRVLGRFWPRARSVLFKEPQRLVAAGLAKATRGAVGRRARTVYEITPPGRRALARWMTTPSTPPSLEWEGLVKVFFAENGSKDDLLATLRSIEEWSRERLREHRDIARAYLDGTGAFPERNAINSLTGGFLADFDALVLAWAQRALDVVDAWPDDMGNAQPDAATMARISNLKV